MAAHYEGSGGEHLLSTKKANIMAPTIPGILPSSLFAQLIPVRCTFPVSAEILGSWLDLVTRLKA